MVYQDGERRERSTAEQSKALQNGEKECTTRIKCSSSCAPSGMPYRQESLNLKNEPSREISVFRVERRPIDREDEANERRSATNRLIAVLNLRPMTHPGRE